MDPARRNILVGLALALAAVRFLVLPWIEAQGDSREQLEVLTNRLDRSTGVVMNRGAITEALARLEKSNAGDRSRFPQSESAESFRLESQQKVTGIITTKNLQIDVFDWILDGPVDPTGLGFVRGRVFLKGDARALGLMLGALEGELPNMVVREAIFGFENRVFSKGEYRANMTLVADFHYRKVPTP